MNESTADQSLALGNSLEDNSTIYTAESHYEDHPVNRLWNFCSSAESSVKLILPDNLHTPFYLRKPRHNKANNEKEIEREKRRLEIQTKREYEGKIGRKKNVSQLIPKTTFLSPREEYVLYLIFFFIFSYLIKIDIIGKL
jgi:hypothetical protein